MNAVPCAFSYEVLTLVFASRSRLDKCDAVSVGRSEESMVARNRSSGGLKIVVHSVGDFGGAPP